MNIPLVTVNRFCVVSALGPAEMFKCLVTFFGLAVTAASQAVPEGYRKVYITSKVDPKFVIVPRDRVAGSTTIVYVERVVTLCSTDTNSLAARRETTL